MALPLRNMDQAAGQAASQVARAASESASEARMMENMRNAQSKDIVKKASGFSVSRMMNGIISKTMNVMWLAPMAGGAIGWLAKKPMLSKASGVLSATSKLAVLPNLSVNGIPASEGVEGVQGLHDAVKDAFKPHHAEKISAGLNSIGKYAQNTIGKTKLGQTALTNLKDASVGNIVMNTGLAVQQTSAAFLSIGDKVRTLKQMQKDLTGQSASTLSILMGSGKLHPLVMNARKETTSVKAMASTGLELAGAAGNIYLAVFDKSKGAKSFAKTMAVGFGPGLLGGVLSSGNTALQSYRDMHLSMAQTGKADIALYEGLIGGLAQKAPSQLVSQIAQKAYEKQLAPEAVLKMVSETNWLEKPKQQPVASRSFVAAEDARRAANQGVIRQTA